MGRVLIAVAAAATLFLPAPASARARDCGPASARTVEQSAAVRVYFAQQGSTKHYYACWRRTGGKPVALVYGGVTPPTSVSRVLIRGRYLAFVYTDCQPDCEYLEVSLVDVKRRERVAFAGELYGSVRTLVATRGGAAAFLASDNGVQYIQRLDSLGVEEIDRGPDVHSLTLHRGRLHWLHGAQARDDHVAHVRRCGPARHAVTVALSKRLRVYYTERGDYRRSYACLLGGGRPLFLAEEDTYPGTAYSYNDDFELRGDHVVWLESLCYAVDGCQARIHGADVRRRSTRSGSNYHEFPRVWVNEKGFAAELVGGGGDPANYYILGFDSTGERVLDEGRGIEPDSISIFDEGVAWRHDGELRSAPLR
jgi:hypothetical protein